MGWLRVHLYRRGRADINRGVTIDSSSIAATEDAALDLLTTGIGVSTANGTKTMGCVRSRPCYVGRMATGNHVDVHYRVAMYDGRATESAAEHPADAGAGDDVQLWSVVGYRISSHVSSMVIWIILRYGYEVIIVIRISFSIIVPVH